MPSIVRDKKRKTWRAIIRRKGHPTTSRSGFRSEIDAKDWATVVETEILYGIKLPPKVPDTPKLTLKEALKEYETKVTAGKKSADREISRITRLCEDKLSSKLIASITRADIKDYIERRKKEPNRRSATESVSESTIRLEVMLISALYTYRITELSEKLSNPVSNISLESSKSRSRNLEVDELEYLKLGIALAMPRSPVVVDLIDTAVETGMRQSELLKVEFNDLNQDGRYLYLSSTKSGDPRKVPLSPKALKILARLDGLQDTKNQKIFPISQDALIRGFKVGCNKGRDLFEGDRGKLPHPTFLVGLNFHDLRHEAARRLTKILSAQELARMFGWRTMDMVLRYYSADIDTIADKISHGLVES
jgi:integrase